jgi:hypothetical protein
VKNIGKRQGYWASFVKMALGRFLRKENPVAGRNEVGPLALF